MRCKVTENGGKRLPSQIICADKCGDAIPATNRGFNPNAALRCFLTGKSAIHTVRLT